MSVRRFLASLPAAFDITQQRALTVARYASALDVNVIDNGDGTRSLAVYFDGFSPTQASLTAWQSDVAAAVVQHPTADEQAATVATNAQTVQQRAQAALTANATFLALASPTNAQTLAQVQRLTKESNALIRLALGLLDTISDTV